MLKQEKTLLKLLPEKYQYLTRDENKTLFVHTNEPVLVPDIEDFEKQWLCSGISAEFPYDNFFDFVKEDRYYLIKELLEGGK